MAEGCRTLGEIVAVKRMNDGSSPERRDAATPQRVIPLPKPVPGPWLDATRSHPG